MPCPCNAARCRREARWRGLLLSLCVWAALLLAALVAMACDAHAGQLSSDDSCRSVRHARRMTKVTVTKPIKAKGRADAGYPMRQVLANTTAIGANLSGNLPLAIAAGIFRFITRPASPQFSQRSGR